MRRVVSVFLPNFTTDRLRKYQSMAGMIPMDLDGAQPGAADQAAIGRTASQEASWEASKGASQAAHERTRDPSRHLPSPQLRPFWQRPARQSPLPQSLGPQPGDALVTVLHDGRRRVLAATDPSALALGLSPGMALAQAQALVPGLTVQEADPGSDQAALRRLAGWCLRYAPLVSADPPDGLWLDVTGCAHLQGGETALMRDLVCRLAAQGLTARAAAADTPGAAHAMARYGDGVTISVPLEAQERVLAPLPIEALRLSPETTHALRLLGFERIGALAATPRAPLVRRFGTEVMRRLDQAAGAVFEPIEPEVPPTVIQARLAFVEPLLTAEAFSGVIDRLVAEVCAALEQAGQGARRLDLLFERVDGAIPTIRIGTARPSRDPRHLARMLDERLERIDPGLGVEAMRLVAPQTNPLTYAQAAARLRREDPPTPDLSPLVDRLGNRVGAGRVYRAAPVQSSVPERSVKAVGALTPPLRTSWPASLPRPVRLLDPPQPVEAMSLLPDHPPVAFTWRRIRHKVRRADGPERIAGEWWKRDGEMRSVRDYFRVEVEDGRRFWLFRRGDGVDGVTGDLRWFLHGFF